MKTKETISTDVLDRKWIDTNIPCKAACPILTDIPGYIGAIIEGDYKKAYLINRNDNVLPSILGRVCTRPCEKVCRHGREGFGEPVSICFLKRSASDYGFENIKMDIKKNGKKICVIGAGPAGLTVANDLAIKGYKITLLEQFEHAGGMLRYGIPQFRLPYDIVAKDVKSIIDLGVEIKTNVRIDFNNDVEKLKNDYDAVVLAGGCMQPKKVDFEGLDKKGMYWGIDFMIDANNEQMNDYKPKNVVVIGGGFTSVDCCRMAYRLGAKNITLCFRRTKDDMAVGEEEVSAMEAEGVNMTFLVNPKRLIFDEEKITGIELTHTNIEKDGSLKEIPDSEFIINCDTVVFAIGQKSDEISGSKKFEQDGNFFMTGDFRNGASTVIEAAADGRYIARKVHEYISKINGYEDVIHISDIKETGRVRDYDFINRNHMDEIPVIERKEKNKEVEIGYSKEKALEEAKRCYLCHYNFQIDIDRCIYCLACIDVMPVDCISMVKDIEIDDKGKLNYIKAASWSEARAIAIDNDKCIRCGNCYRICPVECISISKYYLDTIEKK